MKDISIIDNFLDDREFRNYICSLLPKFGFNDVEIEDVRVSDTEAINDNDVIAIKNDMKYTVQTYLNKIITEKEINETVLDMDKENVSFGLIVSNKSVDQDIRKLALESGIEIIDRDDLIKKI